MQIRTKTSKTFRFRLILLTIMGIGISLYCLYDGAIGFPNQRVRALKYLEFKEEHEDQDQATQKWQAYATEQGWSTENPGKPKDQFDFTGQFIFAGLAGLFGLWFLSSLIRYRDRWIELSDTGIQSSWGKQFGFEQIVSINKAKWDSKGIAKVFYEENGRKRCFVIDDFKYEAQPTRDIMAEVESHITADKIFGGPPEAAKQPQSEQNQEEPTRTE